VLWKSSSISQVTEPGRKAGALHCTDSAGERIVFIETDEQASGHMTGQRLEKLLVAFILKDFETGTIEHVQ